MARTRSVNAIDVLKKQVVVDRREQAQYALDLFVYAMMDDDQPSDIRLAAAREVLDRVLGKPAQMAMTQGDELYQAHLERLRSVIFGQTNELGKTGPTKEAEHDGDGLHPQSGADPNPPGA